MEFNFRRISQDQLESSFSVQRNSQGGSNNPDPQQVDANVNKQNTLQEYRECRALTTKGNCDHLQPNGSKRKREDVGYRHTRKRVGPAVSVRWSLDKITSTAAPAPEAHGNVLLEGTLQRLTEVGNALEECGGLSEGLPQRLVAALSTDTGQKAVEAWLEQLDKCISEVLPAPPPGENKAPKKAVHQQLTAMSTSTAVLELATAFIEGETPATAYYVFASGMRCH